MMVPGTELNRRRQPFQCSLNNLSESRWPPNYLRRRERHANRGLKSVNTLQVEESARAQIIAPTQRDVMLLDLTCQGSTVPSSLNPTQSYLIR